MKDSATFIEIFEPKLSKCGRDYIADAAYPSGSQAPGPRPTPLLDINASPHLLSSGIACFMTLGFLYFRRPFQRTGVTMEPRGQCR